MNKIQNYFEGLKKISDRSQYLRSILQVKQSDQPYTINFQFYPESQTIQGRGIKHHIYLWRPKAQPKGIIIFMHGMQGHSGISAIIAKGIAQKQGLICVGYDFRGYGKSGGEERGYVESLESLVDDTEFILQILVGKFKPKKIFLAGISMGGAVSFEIALKQKFKIDGVIFFAPALRSNYQSSPFMKKLGILIGYLFPTWRFLESAQGFGVKHSCIKSSSDPLNYQGKMVPGSIKSLLVYMNQAPQKFEKFETPYLMIMGGTDKIVDPFIAVDLDRLSKSKDKTTIVVKDMWHYIWKENQLTDLIPEIENWIRKRV